MRSLWDEVREEQQRQVPEAVTSSAVFGDMYDNPVPCRMNESSCSLADLRRGNIADIHPGGGARCIFGSEFFFRVFPGDPDKLMIHLDGGGACWDEMTTTQGITACVPECVVRPMYGAFNTCPHPNGANPFEGYTVILVPQCGGDLHAGNVTHPTWKHPMYPNASVEQRGLINMRSVLEWVKANTAPKLTHFAFSGESAGAIGVQIWSPTILRELSYDRATILSDSYVGVFPDNFQGHIFKNLGVCDSGLLFGENLKKCREGTITIPDVFTAAIQEFPDVLFGNINSKHDSTQVMFYNAALGSMRIAKAMEWCGDVDPNECDLSSAPMDIMEVGSTLEGMEYHQRIEEIIERLSHNPNYISYLLSGDSHVSLPTMYGNCSYLDYTHTDDTHWLGDRDGDQRHSAQSWTRHFFAPIKESKSSRCETFNEGEIDDFCREEQEQHVSA